MQPSYDPDQQPFVSGGSSTDPSLGTSKKKRIIIAGAAVVLLAVTGGTVALLSHHSNAPADESLVAINEKVANVTVDASGLTPKSITVKRGQEITWTNTDSTPHHLTADQTVLPSFDTAEPLQQGDTYTYIFDKSGTFHYYDATDPTHYVGTITVQ
ncbi:MAG TPA: cupredoxin domain-containing protein [Candidatus Saccharimonadales bacterium]|nr:cupredoxin domain-containing protein [Candidatus Saccharimonadales bacterium]